MEYAEFDIRKTKDNVLVVHHDARAQGGDHDMLMPIRKARFWKVRSRKDDPLVADVTYEQLCVLLKRTVPRVDDVMQLLAEGGIRGHLDLKEIGYEEEVVRKAQEVFKPGNFVITTLEGESIKAIKAKFRGVTTALSLGRDRKDFKIYKWPWVRLNELYPALLIHRYEPDWMAVSHKLARWGVLGRCKKLGKDVMVWTVDPEDLMQQFFNDERVRVLITNQPARAVQLREELYRQIQGTDRTN